MADINIVILPGENLGPVLRAQVVCPNFVALPWQTEHHFPLRCRISILAQVGTPGSEEVNPHIPEGCRLGLVHLIHSNPHIMVRYGHHLGQQAHDYGHQSKL